MSEQFVIQIDDKIDASVAGKIKAIGDAAKTSQTQIDKLKNTLNAIDKNAIAVERLAAAQKRTAIASQQLAAATDRAALAHLRLETAQKRAQSSSEKTTRSFSSLSDMLKRGLVIAGTAFGIHEILELGNAYVDLQNKLRVVTTSNEQLSEVSDRVFEIANKTRTSVEATAKAFSRFDLALIQLGGSQEETLRLTETVNKALIVSGAGAEEQSSALLQLSQAFNKGKLDGDEFRSVMELLPTVADAIAKQLKVTRGELLKLAPEGKITADVMRKALASAAEDIDKKFAKTMPTLTQSLTVAKNKAIEFFGQIEKNSGVLSSISKFIFDFSEGLLKTAPAASTLAVAISDLTKELADLGPSTESSVGFISRLFQGLGVIIAAVSDLIRGWKVAVLNTIAFITPLVADFLQIQIQSAEKMSKLFGVDLVPKETLNDLKDFKNHLQDMSVEATKTSDALVEEQLATEKWLKSVEDAEWAVKKLDKAQSALRPSDPTKKPPPATDKAAESRARSLAKINAELDKQINLFGMLDTQRAIFNRVEEIQVQLISKKIKLSEDERKGIEAKITTIENNKKTQEELNKIYGEAANPLKQYNATLQAADMLLQKGTISQDFYNRQMVIAQQVFKGATDPFMQINKSLKDEAELLNFVGNEQQTQNRIQQIRNELLTKGIVLGGSLEESYRKEIQAVIQKNLVNQEQNKIYDELIAKQNLFKAQVEALQLLMQGGADQLQMGTAKTTLFSNMFEGTQEAFDAETKKYADFLAQIDELRQKDLISEKTAFQLKMKADQQLNDKRLQGASTFFGNLAVLQKSGSRQLFEIGKAAALAQATIDGIASVQKALSGYPPPYSFAMAAAAGVVAAANVASIASTNFGGFKEGGFTGMGGTSQVAGVVHGQEFVVNADATAKNRPVLEAMNRGGSVAAGPAVAIKIENYGTSKDFEVQQINESEIRIIARDEARETVRRDVPSLVASEIANPNSQTSKSLSRNTQTSRRR